MGGIKNNVGYFTNDNFRPLQPLDKLPTEDDDDEVAVINHLLEPPVVAVLAPAAPATSAADVGSGGPDPPGWLIQPAWRPMPAA